MADSVQEVARFFDREACCAGRRSADAPVHGVSRVLLGLLQEAGLAGRSVLEAGCGQGSLAIALSRQGARNVTGVDLSPGSIAVARQAAEQSGACVRFSVADAAVDNLRPHDVVVLDKVVCCYFDAAGLLAHTVGAARSVCALSLPHSRGWRGRLARLLVRAENAWRRVGGERFRAFVHDADVINHALTVNGFSPAAQRDHWTWQAIVYERATDHAA